MRVRGVLKKGWLGAFPLYLSMSSAVAGCVGKADLCTSLQFTGQTGDKWTPPSPFAPNVSHLKKLRRSLAWPKLFFFFFYPRTIATTPNTLFFPLSFPRAREALNVTVYPFPPNNSINTQHSPPPNPAAIQHSHLLSLTYANAADSFSCWWLFLRGRVMSIYGAAVCILPKWLWRSLQLYFLFENLHFLDKLCEGSHVGVTTAVDFTGFSKQVSSQEACAPQVSDGFDVME